MRSKEAPTSVTVTFDEEVVAENRRYNHKGRRGNSPSGVTAGLEADNKTVTDNLEWRLC